MLIDWFTVGAQTVNFLVLVWLLKRYLYHPILNAIDERERRVATELSLAAVKQAQAQQQRNEFQQKNADFEQQRAALLSQMISEVQFERQKLLDAAKQEVDIVAEKRMDALRNDNNKLKQAIRFSCQQDVFAIVRKVLSDLANSSLEQAMVKVMMRRLHGLNADDKALFAEAINSSVESVLLRSAFPLSEVQGIAIQQTLNDVFSMSVTLRFETNPYLVSGIELCANSQKIAWSIDDYLESLQQALDSLLKNKDSLITDVAD